MRILHICPTSRLDAPIAPESLQYLGHHIIRCGAEKIPTCERDQLTADVVIADACLDLSIAPTIAEALTARQVSAPVIVVLGEGGLATASAKWNVSDLILTTAGPAEVEARLRVARDRHLGEDRIATLPGSSHSSSNRSSTNRTGAPRLDANYGGDGDRNADGEPMVVVTGSLRIDETSFTAFLGRRSLDLTYREFALLKFFALHPERVFTRDEILAAVWGDDYFGGTRTVDVHVRRLRAKLGKDLENAIHTVRNVGYRFSADSVTDPEDVQA
jgi:DNA-binding response OmpR family regulator